MLFPRPLIVACTPIISGGRWLLGIAFLSGSVAAANQAPASPEPAGQLLTMPMHFEKNHGQTDSAVDFVSRGPGYSLFLTPTEAVLSLQQKSRRNFPTRTTTKQAVLRMKLLRSDASASGDGLEKLAGVANYFVGPNPEDWHASIPMFGKVRYRHVYPGIDLVYYGNQRQLEYDFVLEPKANPKDIRLGFSGAERMEIDRDGGLVAHLSEGQVRWKKPFAYQEIDGRREEVAARFVLKNRKEVAFQIGTYDTSRPLIIDPVLVYATYIGGGGGDFPAGISVNAAGQVFIVGDTTSLNFPTTNAFRATAVGSNDVFVTKLNANGSGLVFSTYLGGSGDDFGAGITIDAAGNAFVTGHTESPNFPTRNAAYSANAGFADAFLTKLAPNGTSLIYSTYLGGSGDDFGRAVAVDSGGNAFITGRTFSKGTGNGPFPTTQGVFQGNNGGGNAISADAFVTKFDTNGVLAYSTFLGGVTEEKGNGIAVDSSGNAYVVGEVASYPTFPDPPSSNFPLLSAFQSQFNAGSLDPLAGSTDGFLTKLNAAGSALIFSTFLGGQDNDFITGIALDPAGRICLTGITGSTNFPVFNAAQPVNGGYLIDPLFPGPDAFATVFQTSGTSLYYSTYLGGTIDEFPFLLDRFGIAVDRFGNLFLAGETGSFDFPVTDGADQTNSFAATDVYVAKINPSIIGPASLIYASLLSGSTGMLAGGAINEAAGIAVDTNSNFYVAGITSATNFPVTGGAYRTSNGGGFNDGFIAKFSSPPDLSVTMVASINPVIVGSNVTYTLRVNNNGRSTFSGVSNLVQFPPNVRFGAITSTLGGSSTNASGLVTFNIGTLTNNASVTQTIVITNQSAGTFTNVATVTGIETLTLEPNKGNNVAAVVANVQGIADVTLVQSDSPDPAPVGGNLVYTVGITNKGPMPATAVLLTNVLSPLVEFVSATNTSGNCSNINGTVVCDFGVLGNGAGARVTIATTPVGAGTANNFASVSSFEADFTPANNSSSIPTTLTGSADVRLGMTAPTNSIYAGMNLTYTLQVTNFGPIQANSVVLTNPFPAGATFVSATTSVGTTNLSPTGIGFNLGSLSNSAIATATLTVRFSAAGTPTNNASVSASTTDPAPGNNLASLVTTVLAASDLALTHAASPGTLFVGSNVNFTITVSNRGPSTAPSFTLTDTLPSSFLLIAVQWNQGSWSIQGDGAIIMNGGSLANGATATAIITASPRINGVFSNSATVTCSTDLVAANNSAGGNVTANDDPSNPLLRIIRSGNNVVLSWSTNAESFILQSKADLTTNSAWVNVTNNPVRVGTRWHVTNSIVGSPKFYRLRQNSPNLSAIRVGNNVVVSWPINAGNGVLKSTTGLSNQSVWTVVSSPSPVVVGDRYWVTNPASTTRRFYRLYN